MWSLLCSNCRQWPVLLFLIVQLFSVVTGSDLTITQRLADNETNSVIIRGVATYVVNTNYFFDCTSATYGTGMRWQRDEGGVKSQNTITGAGGVGGIRLKFSNPTADDGGIHRCVPIDNEADSVTLDITTVNPAVQAKTDTITVLAGTNVSIEFYASGIPFITSNDITWTFNDSVTVTDIINNNSDRRILVINSANSTHNGVYKMTINSTVSATTKLTVLTPPVFLFSPLNASNVTEWTTFSLNCTVTGSLDIIKISWFRSNESPLPEQHTITNMTTEDNLLISVLTVSAARVSDSGLYGCNASFTDNTNITASDLSHVTVTGGVRMLYVPQDTNSSFVIVSSLLLYTYSSSFYIDCQGTGNLTWTQSSGTAVSSSATSIPYQSLKDSSKRLNFTDSLTRGELYTCTSSTGASGSVYVTSDNPAIYTPNSVITVTNPTNILNTSISVYTDGSDPAPTPDNITWYHNNLMISDSQPVYQLTRNNTVLLIQGQGSSVIGTYEARVMTSQGENSILINITYPDAPVVRIDGPSVASEGDTVILYCNVTSLLPLINITWYYITDTDETILQYDDPLLMIVNITRNFSGYYQCSADDGISTTNHSIQLLIQYPPLASINTTSITLSEGEVMTSFQCQSDGYPTPNITWIHNNSTILPNGITQVQDILNWTRPVLHTDEGNYTCVSTNNIGSSRAVLRITVSAPPKIYSIYSAHPGSIIEDASLLKFRCPQSPSSPINNCSIKCIGRGWPTPTVVWKDSNGHILNSSSNGGANGVAETIINWNGTREYQYQCQVNNDYGSKTKTILLMNDGLSPPPTTPSSYPPQASSVTLRIQLLTRTCLRDGFLSELSSSLGYIMSSLCPGCAYHLLPIDSDCTVNHQSTFAIFNLSSNTSQAYQSLSLWWAKGPTVLIGQDLIPVERDCKLLVQESDPTSCVPVVTPSPSVTITSTTTASPTAGATTGTIVAISLILFIFLIIVAVLILVLVLNHFYKRTKKNTQVDNCDLKSFNNAENDDKTDRNGRGESETGFQNASFDNSDYATVQPSTSVLNSSQISTSSQNNESSSSPSTLPPPPAPQYEDIDNILISPYSEISTLQKQKTSPTQTDESPTKRVTQVPLINTTNEYQLPYEPHQYDSVADARKTTDHSTRSGSPYVEPVPVSTLQALSPYMEPVPSTSDLKALPTAASAYMQPVPSTGDLTLSPIPTHTDPLPPVGDQQVPDDVAKRGQRITLPPIYKDISATDITNDTADNNNASWYKTLTSEDITTPTYV